MLANKKKMFENHAIRPKWREFANGQDAEYKRRTLPQALTVNPAKACQPLGAVFAGRL